MRLNLVIARRLLPLRGVKAPPNSYTRLLGLRISLETFGVYSGWVASAERGDGSGGLGPSATQQAGRTARAERHQPDFRRHRGPSLGGRNCRIGAYRLGPRQRGTHLLSAVADLFAFRPGGELFGRTGAE